MFCTKCGAKLEDNANFCPVCGQKIVREKKLEKSTEAVSVQEQDLTNEAMVENGQVQQTAEDPVMKEPVTETVPAGATPALVKEETSIPNPDSIHTKSEKPFETPDSPPQTSNQTPVSHNDAPQQAPLESAPTQKKPPVKLIAIAVAIVIVLIIIVASVLKSYNSPSNKFSRAMGQEDYITASTLYSTLDSTEKQKALKMLTELAWNEIEEYSEDTTAYEGVADWLDTLENLFPELKAYTSYAPDVRDQLENLKKVKDHLANASAAESDDDIPKAIAEYEEAIAATDLLISDLSSIGSSIPSKIDSLEKKYESEILAGAQERYSKNDLSGAIAVLQESQQLLQDNSDIELLLNQYLKEKTESDIMVLLDEAKQLADASDYPGAIQKLSRASFTDSRITIQIAEYKTAYENIVASEAKGLVEEEKYDEAITLLSSALKVVDDSEMLSELCDTYTEKYVSKVVELAKSQYIPYNAQSIYAAESILSEALQIVPEDQNLQSEMSFYEEHEPIKVFDFEGEEYGTFVNKDVAVDNMGVSHQESYGVTRFAFEAFDEHYPGEEKWRWYAYRTIDVDFQYSKITGTLFQTEKYKSATSETVCEVMVYSDDDNWTNHKYTWAGLVSGNTENASFDVDISGEKFVTLLFLGDYTSGKENQAYDYAYLSDVYLWK